MIRFKKRLFSLYTFLFLAAGLSLTSQTPNSNLTPGGANGMVFRFTKQVWLNPTVILAKQKFEQATNVKLLILPRTNASDTSNNTKIEKAFDKLLAFLVFKENIQGSIKFYFNPKNPSKPFSFDWSEDLQCKFNKFHNLYKDTIEGILNNGLVNHPSLNNFAALPFDSIIGKASRYCRNILLLHPAPCGENQNSEFDLAQINSTPAKLEFAKVPNTSLTYNGGYDILTYNELEAYYNTVTDLADGSTYKVGWKAIKDDDILKLKLTKKQPSFDVSKLVFKNAKGTVSYNVSVNPDSTLSLSMGGQSPGSMAEVVAYYTPTTTPVQTYPIGAFNVKLYEPKIYNLVLVSLDANPLSLEDQAKLKDSLNKIYGPVFIQWNLSQVRYNLPTTISKSIHDASSGLLSNYMPDMQPILSSFKNSSSYNGNADNTVYIILGASIDNTEIKGYMPRARNTGFVFVQPEVSSFFIRTLAHEVGHGAFNLKHIFSSDELGEGNKTQTNNVMDYASGRQLYKHQWDLIHDPSFVGWFEGDDEEGALLANQCNESTANLTYGIIQTKLNDAKSCPPPVSTNNFCSYRDKFTDYINSACSEALVKLTNEERFNSIKSISDGFNYASNNLHKTEEWAILRLLGTLVQNKTNGEYLLGKLAANNFALLQKLRTGIDGENYSKLISFLTQIAEVTYPYNSQILNVDEEIFRWNGKNGGINFTIYFNQQGLLESVIHTSTGMDYKMVTLHPYNSIGILSKVKLPGIKNSYNGKYYTAVVPALYLKWLYDKGESEAATNLAFAAGSILTLQGGISTAINSANILVKVFGILEVTSGVSSLALDNTPLEEAIVSEYGQSGQSFVTNVRFCLNMYNAASGTGQLIKLTTSYAAARGFWIQNRTQIKNKNIIAQSEFEEFDDFLNEARIGNGVGSILNKVVLGSEELSQFAINFRKTLTIPNHKGNVAVFEYLDNSGNLIKKAFTTEVGVASHSEELAIDFFISQNIPKASIKRIYSELEPCELAGHTCKAKLTENFPTAQKIFSYDYPGSVDNTIRAASVNQRFIDLQQLLQ